MRVALTIVKKIIFFSTFVSFLIIANISLAQIDYFGVDANLNEKGRTSLKYSVTFKNPDKNFKFNVIGRVENLTAQSLAGPIICTVEVSGISTVLCNLTLSPDKKSIELLYETNDFVKSLDNKFYFDTDLGLNQNIDRVFVFLKLPEGMALIGENVANRLSFPLNATTISDGRHIIVVWSLNEIKGSEPLRFQALYENLPFQIPFQIRIRYVAIFGIATAGAIAFVYLKYFRKPERLILSVLDEYERKVMDALVAAGGEVNQKKIVQETNLSKAKVSRVVRSLSERGVLTIERIGKQNKLKLLKKKFNF